MEKDTKNTTIIGSPSNQEEISSPSFVKDMFRLMSDEGDLAVGGSVIGVPIQPQLSLFSAGVFDFAGVASAVGIGAVAAVKTIGKKIEGEDGGVFSMWWSEAKKIDSALSKSRSDVDLSMEKSVAPKINISSIEEIRSGLDVNSTSVLKKNAL